MHTIAPPFVINFAPKLHGDEGGGDVKVKIPPQILDTGRQEGREAAAADGGHQNVEAICQGMGLRQRRADILFRGRIAGIDCDLRLGKVIYYPATRGGERLLPPTHDEYPRAIGYQRACAGCADAAAATCDDCCLALQGGGGHCTDRN
jgi:hypothetical protein